VFRAVNEALARAARVLVGVSFATPQFARMGRLARRLKAEFGSRIELVAGGPHPTAEPAETLALGFDVVVRGEGEVTFQELVKQSGHADYSLVKGIAFRDESGRARLTEPRPWIDLNAFPPWAAKHRKVGAIEITRGCAYACGFCQTSHLFGGRFRHRSVARLAECVEWMMRRRLLDVRLLSPSAFSYGAADRNRPDLAALEDLLSGLRRILGSRGRLFFGSFPSEARPEHITPETLGLLKRYANNGSLVVGAQSGSDAALERCRRGHTVEQVFSGVALALRAGFKVNVDFILGLPGETARDMDLTAALGARIHAHSFMPLPQTAFAAEPPSHLSKRLLDTAHKLMGRGQLYGQWQEQARFSRAG
jgi:B12-binding domain/radical SAM domain protein